jgi:hypothetical protein
MQLVHGANDGPRVPSTAVHAVTAANLDHRCFQGISSSTVHGFCSVLSLSAVRAGNTGSAFVTSAVRAGNTGSAFVTCAVRAGNTGSASSQSYMSHTASLCWHSVTA